MSTSGIRARQSTLIQRWTQQDEVPAPRALDDSGWQVNQWPAKIAAVSLAVFPLLFGADQEFIPTAAASALDDQATWQAPITSLPKVQTGAFWHQDEIPAAAVVAPGDAGFTAYGQRAISRTQIVRWTAGDELPSATAAIFEPEIWSAPIMLRQALPLQPAFGSAEEVPVAAVSAPSDSAIAVYGQRSRSETRFVQWPQSDDLPVPPIFHPVEEDAPDVTGMPPVYQVVVWAGDEEIVPQPPLTPDDGHWALPYWVAASPALMPPWTDESSLPPIEYEPETWEAPTIVKAIPQLQVWGDADIVPAAAPLMLEEEWTRPITLANALAPLYPWSADDAVPQVPPALTASDDAWTQFIPAMPQIASLQTWGADDFAAAPAALDDDSRWTPPVVVANPPMMAVWTQQDERATPPTPLLVDLDFLELDLRSYQPAADSRVFQDDGNFTPEPVYVFTHDSRTRIGPKRGRVLNRRIGPNR